MNEVYVNYGFSYNMVDPEAVSFPKQNTQNKNITVTDVQPWPVVLREFANFLSGIYGCDISSKLLLQEWDGDHVRLSDYGV